MILSAAVQAGRGFDPSARIQSNKNKNKKERETMDELEALADRIEELARDTRRIAEGPNAHEETNRALTEAQEENENLRATLAEAEAKAEALEPLIELLAALRPFFAGGVQYEEGPEFLAVTLAIRDAERVVQSCAA